MRNLIEALAGILGRAVGALDTPGGHIAVLVALMLAAWAAARFGLPKAEDVLVGSFGALLAVLRNTAK